MTRFVLRRLLTLIPVLALVSFLSFSLIYLVPGDPAQALLGDNVGDEQLYQQLRSEMGLDKSFLGQFWAWVHDLLTGSLGQSTSGQSVLSQIGASVGPTLQLATMAMVIAIVVGISLGIVAAYRVDTKTDTIISTASVVGFSAPGFLIGILLLYLFSIVWPVFPSGGYIPFLESPLESIQSLVLPAVALSFALTAVLVRQMRGAMLQTLSQDFILVARAKGLSSKSVLLVHAVKNSVIPVLTVIGLQLGTVFGGVAVIETVFSIPGLGRLAVDSIANRNYPVLQAVILFSACIVIAANFLTDLLYAFVDPRVRYA